MLNVDGWTDGRTDEQTNGRTHGRKLARLCLPAKAGVIINTGNPHKRGVDKEGFDDNFHMKNSNIPKYYYCIHLAIRWGFRFPLFRMTTNN